MAELEFELRTMQSPKTTLLSYHILGSDRFYFLDLKKSLHMVKAATKLKDTCSLEGKL